jgi:hypothetical protein
VNRSFVFGALVASSFLGQAAFADTGLAGDISIDPHPFVSTRSQAEVRQELAQYQRAGVNPWATGYNPLRYFRSVRTREDVQQEYMASRQEVRAFTGEDSGAAWLAQHRATPAPTNLANAQE